MNVKNFCKSLDKPVEARKYFLLLSQQEQKLFLDYSNKIINLYNPKLGQLLPKIFRNAYLVFKIFSTKQMKELSSFRPYNNTALIKKLEPLKNLFEKTRSRSSSSSSGRKKYDKPYQRYAQPAEEDEAITVFYTSLYEQNPESPLAITWLTERGFFEDTERDELIQKYVKLEKESKLIK
jgi:hypothetical protein